MGLYSRILLALALVCTYWHSESLRFRTLGGTELAVVEHSELFKELTEWTKYTSKPPYHIQEQLRKLFDGGAGYTFVIDRTSADDTLEIVAVVRPYEFKVLLEYVCAVRDPVFLLIFLLKADHSIGKGLQMDISYGDHYIISPMIKNAIETTIGFPITGYTLKKQSEYGWNLNVYPVEGTDILKPNINCELPGISIEKLIRLDANDDVFVLDLGFYKIHFHVGLSEFKQKIAMTNLLESTKFSHTACFDSIHYVDDVNVIALRYIPDDLYLYDIILNADDKTHLCFQNLSDTTWIAVTGKEHPEDADLREITPETKISLKELIKMMMDGVQFRFKAPS